MAFPTLDQVLSAGSDSPRDIGVGNVIGFGRIIGNPDHIIELRYIHNESEDLGEIHLIPVGPNADEVRTVLFDMGKGVWILEYDTGLPLVATSDLGLHCSKNITAHISMAARKYIESTEGFVKAATFLNTQGGIVRFLGEEPTRPQLWFDSAWFEYVFNRDTTAAPGNKGAAPLRAENVISAKASFYYNENLMGMGPGMKIRGAYNIDKIEMPFIGSGDYSKFRVTFKRPIVEPVVVVTPFAMNLSNATPVNEAVKPLFPVLPSLTKVTDNLFEVQLWQTVCEPEPLGLKNYGFDVFNDIGMAFHVSGRLKV